MCVCVCARVCVCVCQSLSHVWLFVIPWIVIPSGFSVHGTSQARTLAWEWVVICHSRGSSQPRDWTHVSCVSCIGRWILYHSATWESLRVFPLWLKWVTHWSNVVFPCRSYENSSQLNVQLIFQSKFQNYLMGKDSLLKTYARTNG